ncbi:MAG TPA: hypothetical protein DCX53_06445 [Anaerolineae bacterium]|nr:hypothetical protein [Anaerolineae bacterium]
MNKKYLIVIGGLLAALLVVGVVGATSAYAQASANTPMHGRGPGGEGHKLDGAALEAAAEALGMTTDEVTSALKDGKTLQDLADEAGVDIADVRAALQAVRETEMRDRIAQAVEDGKMTQEKADWLLEGLDKGFLDGPGFGGPRGPKGGNAPFGQPPVGNGE